MTRKNLREIDGLIIERGGKREIVKEGKKKKKVTMSKKLKGVIL